MNKCIYIYIVVYSVKYVHDSGFDVCGLGYCMGTGEINSPGVGVTKTPFVNFSVTRIFAPAKVYITFF